MYFWSFHFSWKDSGGWGAQHKKSCGAYHRSITYDGRYYHHAAVMVSKISCKGWTWRRYQGLGHSWKEAKYIIIYIYYKLLHIVQMTTYIFTWCIFYRFRIYIKTRCPLFSRFLRRGVELFPNQNKQGDLNSNWKRGKVSNMCQMTLSDGQILRTLVARVLRPIIRNGQKAKGEN